MCLLDGAARLSFIIHIALLLYCPVVIILICFPLKANYCFFKQFT
jgi:hypothetical protein